MTDATTPMTVSPSEAASALTTLLPLQEPLMLVGPPGAGKTSLVTQACDTLGYDLLTRHPVVDDPTDYKGLPVAMEDGTAKFTPFGDLMQLLHADRPTVCLLDDLGQAPPAVQAAAMQLLLARRINGHAVSDSVVFVAATNRREDRAGVSGILEPVKSRFAAILHVEPNADDWIKWAIDAGLHPTVIAFVAWRPSSLSDWEPTGRITNGGNPRTLHALSRLVAAGIDSLPVLAGAAGEGVAREYVAFASVAQDAVAPEDIIADPSGVDLPDDGQTDVIYAILMNLVTHLKDTENQAHWPARAGATLTYVQRLGPEWMTIYGRQLQTVTMRLTDAEGYSEFMRQLYHQR